jgi:putative membrane protein
MKKWLFAGSICALAVVACSKDDDEQDTNNVDVNFVAMASMSNNAEIMTGQLAATKGNTQMVKSFGQQMVTEHTAAQEDLRGLASQANVTATDSVDSEHKALLVTLNSLSGRAFDSAYIKSQVADHARTIDLFNTEISGGQNSQIRSYATQYLPGIQMHYNRADSIQKAF